MVDKFSTQVIYNETDEYCHGTVTLVTRHQTIILSSTLTF